MPETPASSIQRHYGLDWLRIGAFALLIVFHLGLYFAPGHWIVKSPRTFGWVQWPLAAIVPWRLSVLFAVSGYATAAMIQRHATLGRFLAERSKRLLIPLAFGMLVVVPPQGWVRLAVSGSDLSFANYLRHDAYSFAPHAGVFMPGWEHLWFLPYLWAYTLLLVALLGRWPDWKERADEAALWLASGRRLIWLPAMAMTAAMIGLSRLRVPGLADSADYLPAFLAGFGYAHLPRQRRAFADNVQAALLLSSVALAVLWINLAAAGTLSPRIEEILAAAAGGVMSWTMIPVAFTLAERLLNRDHAWRQPLAAAVFPAYIVHQTVIVVLGWWLARQGVTGWSALLVMATTLAASLAATWLLARDVPWLGTLLGMPRKRPMALPATTVPALA